MGIAPPLILFSNWIPGGYRPGDLKCHLGGIDLVIAAIYQVYPDVYEWIAGQRPGIEGFSDAFLNARDKLDGNGAAPDLVLELDQGRRMTGSSSIGCPF